MHSPDLPEFIGAESCFILQSDVADYTPPPAATNNHRRSRLAAEKEYPPPMERFPSVMTKCITGDGRVVLKKEKVKRREYLWAHRSDGRFLLNLHVEELDDDIPENMDGEDDGVADDFDPTVVEEEEEEEKVGSSSSCYNNVYNYNESGVNNTTCGGHAPVAAFGPPPVLT